MSDSLLTTTPSVVAKPEEPGLSFLIPIISIIGIIGNVTVLVVYIKKMQSSPGVNANAAGRSLTNIFIATLALNDLVACAVVMPLTLIYELAPALIFTTNTSCKLYYLVTTSVIPFSAFLMTAISVDRYLCICQPLKQILTPLRCKVVVITLAVIATIMGTLVAIQTNAANAEEHAEAPNNTIGSHDVGDTTTTASSFYPVGGCTPVPVLGEAFLDYYHYIHNTITFVVALAVTFVFYALIYSRIWSRHLQKATKKAAVSRALQQGNNNNNNNPNSSTKSNPEITITTADISSPTNEHVQQQPNDNNNKECIPLIANNSSDAPTTPSAQRKSGEVLATPKQGAFKISGELGTQIRLAAMLFVVTVVFTLSYVPAFLANYTSLFGDEVNVDPWNRFVFYIYFVNNAANPIIYGVMNRNFREDLRQLCCGNQKYNNKRRQGGPKSSSNASTAAESQQQALRSTRSAV